jgi:hypothetical protein
MAGTISLTEKTRFPGIVGSPVKGTLSPRMYDVVLQSLDGKVGPRGRYKEDLVVGAVAAEVASLPTEGRDSSLPVAPQAPRDLDNSQ